MQMRNPSSILLFIVLLLTAAWPSAAWAYHEMEDWRHMAQPTVPEEQYKPYALQRLEAKAGGASERGAEEELFIPEPIHYEVNQGDTLSRIARYFDITVQTLASANGIQDIGRLSVGQKLMVPVLEAAVFSKGGEKRIVEKVLVSKLTAYTAGKESTGKTPSHPAYGITASGAKVKEGRTIAVDPKVIPYGTTVYIEGVGLRVAEDTGSAIRGTRVDVYMEDLKEAIEFGVKKNVKVYVLSSS